MAIKPVKAKRPDKPTGRLMDMQDTEHKGDGGKDEKSSEKVMMSFMIPADLRKELKERAALLGTSSARLIVDGIRLRLKQED